MKRNKVNRPQHPLGVDMPVAGESATWQFVAGVVGEMLPRVGNALGFVEELRRQEREADAVEMERLGLAADQESVNDAGFTPQTGEACVNRILNALPRENWPTAMIAINDLVALGAMRQLQRMNIRVPEDMALIGCDNQFFTPFLTPPLTTVDLHPFDHGALAIRELVNAVKGNASAFSQVRECSLIVRESCGALLGIRPELA